MLKKEVACRIGVMKEGDKELIELTEKYLTIKPMKK
jgi:hypothetical protein